MKYVANPNGDWWLVEDHVELYVLDLESLSPEYLAEVMAYGLEEDKFEEAIITYGTYHELAVE
jgi:hypothetical protein